MPAQVFKLLQAQDSSPVRGSRHIRFLGEPVCNRGFMRLAGVGKTRFRTLSSAAQKGREFCPYDGRYVVRDKPARSEAWEAVHGFLTQLYTESAEPIPDGINSNKRPRQGDKKIDSLTLDRSKIKHLPYGSIADYWRQCVAAHPTLKIGRKLFCSDIRPLSRIIF